MIVQEFQLALPTHSFIIKLGKIHLPTSKIWVKVSLLARSLSLRASNVFFKFLLLSNKISMLL